MVDDCITLLRRVAQRSAGTAPPLRSRPCPHRVSGGGHSAQPRGVGSAVFMKTREDVVVCGGAFRQLGAKDLRVELQGRTCPSVYSGTMSAVEPVVAPAKARALHTPSVRPSLALRRGQRGVCNEFLVASHSTTNPSLVAGISTVRWSSHTMRRAPKFSPASWLCKRRSQTAATGSRSCAVPLALQRRQAGVQVPERPCQTTARNDVRSP